MNFVNIQTTKWNFNETFHHNIKVKGDESQLTKSYTFKLIVVYSFFIFMDEMQVDHCLDASVYS